MNLKSRLRYTFGANAKKTDASAMTALNANDTEVFASSLQHLVVDLIGRDPEAENSLHRVIDAFESRFPPQQKALVFGEPLPAGEQSMSDMEKVFLQQFSRGMSALLADRGKDPGVAISVEGFTNRAHAMPWMQTPLTHSEFWNRYAHYNDWTDKTRLDVFVRSLRLGIVSMLDENPRSSAALATFNRLAPLVADINLHHAAALGAGATHSALPRVLGVKVHNHRPIFESLHQFKLPLMQAALEFRLDVAERQVERGDLNSPGIGLYFIAHEKNFDFPDIQERARALEERIAAAWQNRPAQMSLLKNDIPPANGAAPAPA